MWEITVGNQAATFLYSLIFGAILCLYYDMARILRLSIKHSFFAVFCEDLFFWITAAFAVFLFLLARTNGELRGYVFVSLLAGFFGCRLTFSKIFMHMGMFCLSQILKILRIVKYFYCMARGKLMYICCRISKNIGKFVKKLFWRAKKS